jgi:hypothetical protein
VIQQVFGEARTYADFFGHDLPQFLLEAGQIQSQQQYTEALRNEMTARAIAEENNANKSSTSNAKALSCGEFLKPAP